MSPAIVKHPFTDSGYALVSVKEGVPSFENIMTEAEYRKIVKLSADHYRCERIIVD